MLPEVVGDPATMRLRVQPDVDSRISLRDGRWPTGTTTKGPDRTPQAGAAPPVTLFEIAISRETADGLGVAAGDTLMLRTDLTDPLVGQGHKSTIGATIVGTFDVNDEADTWWLGGTELTRPFIRSLGGDSRITDTVGLLSPEAYQAFLDETRALFLPLRYTFREFVDATRIKTGAVDETMTELRRLEVAYPSVNVTSIQTTALRTGLRGILEQYRSQWGAANALLTVGVIGPAAVAFAALGLVAVLAAQRRRSALALARGRGASLTQVAVAVVVEGTLLAVPAAAAAVALAMVVVPVDPVAPSIAAAALVAAVAVVLLVLATVPATSGPSFGPAREPLVPRPPTTRRLVFEGLVVLLAVGGAILLRERGVRGTSSAGELAQADPFVAAVPALIGIAAGLIAVRLFPLPMALLARLARRRRGLVPLLAMRRSMQATSSGPVLIVLLATATIAAFSSAVLVHLDRASAAAAWQSVGAAYRMDSNYGSLPTGFDPAALPDAEAGAVVYVSTMNIGTRALRVDFVALAADAYDRVVAGTPADPNLPVDLFAEGPPLIPLVVSAAVADRPDGARPGDQFTIAIEGRTFQARVVAVRDNLPRFSRSELVIVASRDQIAARFPDAPMRPSIALVRAPEASGPAIRAAFLTAMPIGGTFTARADVTRDLRDSPASRAVVTGITAAAILASVYAAIAFAAAVALAGAARAVEVAHLRTLGLNDRQAAGLILLEHGPTVIAAFAAGLALGLGLLLALRDGLGLDALVGSRVDVPIGLEPSQLALVLGGIVAVVALGLALGTRMQRGAAPTAAVRRGFE